MFPSASSSTNREMSTIDATQFASVASHYHHMPTLPEGEVLNATLGQYLIDEDLRGKRVLDLACGTGRWARFACRAGAREVVAVDVSRSMVEAAKRLSIQEPERHKIRYSVADCSQPLVGPLFAEHFDVVLAVCFLNYAPNEPAMREMWQVIASNLRAGGKVVALVPNLDLQDDFSEPIDPRYGTSFELVNQVNLDQDDWGYETRFIAQTGSTPTAWNMYRLNRQVYVRSASEVGLGDIEFHDMRCPVMDHPSGYWDEYQRRPHYELLTATR